MPKADIDDNASKKNCGQSCYKQKRSDTKMATKTPSAKKSTGAKVAAKKTVAKPVAKKIAVKPAAKKAPVAKRPVTKKVVAKPAPKKAVAKPAAKKVAKKPVAKKPVAKKAVAKPVAKKPAAKKPVAKKTTPKPASAKVSFIPSEISAAKAAPVKKLDDKAPRLSKLLTSDNFTLDTETRLLTIKNDYFEVSQLEKFALDVNFMANHGFIRNYIRDVQIAPGVSKLNSRALADFSNLREITIPEGVGMLYESVFSSCTALKKVVVNSNSFDIRRANNMFIGCRDVQVLVKNKNVFKEFANYKNMISGGAVLDIKLIK